ncbi:hypothetical protein AKJ40_00325 [candidate division MSBL1 archaeon SCGC-AAA259M10]|uniref:tRNA carboxymethyluridine synthase n=1 Tax=candidate division MSBL1 archaeon SCGC-AAA259M10 TaxID=1698270 RepID=A0A133V338_9EURY|nr:hypothetical protein AKJ40_00325 [candidate division MSBL1 archaeon SCGC-AAA259M10]
MKENETNLKANRKILEKIKAGEIKDKKDLEKTKREISKNFNLAKVPSNAEILELAEEKEREKVLPLLQRKPVRSISGVTVITVMPRPYPCPKDEPCIYCPGGPEKNTPQSYTGEEPASARAKKADYDPVKQIKARKEQLRAIGHEVDKVELIVFGGTFLAQPENYQKRFMHKCIDTISDLNTPDLKSAKKKAEKAKVRTIGITFETRPDYCRQDHINKILQYGGTRVEIGVQTIYRDIYELTNREHTLEDVINSTREAKDSGLAIVYHIMPGLPGSSEKRDLKTIENIFSNPNFRPDMLKIYPCLVTKDTELYNLWKKGKFDPLEGEKAVDLIAKMKKKVPKWVRIQRVQRDIPSGLIEGGVQKGNLRDIAKNRLEDMNENCSCIRCREVGHRMLKNEIEPNLEDADLLVNNYKASQGEEIFISYEDLERDIIFGHLRLRIPSDKAQRPEVKEDTALVRMLYVFGELVSVGRESDGKSWQHRGLGKEMLKKAERIAQEDYDCEKLAVLSGIGSRPYYRKFNYRLEGPYMVKKL